MNPNSSEATTETLVAGDDHAFALATMPHVRVGDADQTVPCGTGRIALTLPSARDQVFR